MRAVQAGTFTGLQDGNFLDSPNHSCRKPNSQVRVLPFLPLMNLQRESGLITLFSLPASPVSGSGTRQDSRTVTSWVRFSSKAERQTAVTQLSLQDNVSPCSVHHCLASLLVSDLNVSLWGAWLAQGPVCATPGAVSSSPVLGVDVS